MQQQSVPPRKKSTPKDQGMFHGLSDVIREAIVLVAMKDAPSTRKKNNDAIQAQATAQQMKIELLKKKIWNVRQKHSLMACTIIECISHQPVRRMKGKS